RLLLEADDFGDVLPLGPCRLERTQLRQARRTCTDNSNSFLHVQPPDVVSDDALGAFAVLGYPREEVAPLSNILTHGKHDKPRKADAFRGRVATPARNSGGSLSAGNGHGAVGTGGHFAGDRAKDKPLQATLVSGAHHDMRIAVLLGVGDDRGSGLTGNHFDDTDVCRTLALRQCL